MALQPHRAETSNNARGIPGLRVLLLHKKSLSTQQPACRDNHHLESYAAHGLSAEEDKRLGLSIGTADFGGLVGEGGGSLRRRKGGLAAAARTGGGGGGGGGDLKGAATHFPPPPRTPHPPAAPATPPPRGNPYYEYAYEEDDYPAAVSIPAGDPTTTDASGLPDAQSQVSRNVSFNEEVKEVLIENRRQAYGNKASRRQHFYSKAELATFKRAWHCHVKSSSRPVNGVMACGCPGCDYDYDEGRAPPTLQKVVPPADYNRWVWEG